ncbi:MAG: hypothetical protein ABFE01_28365 [Phycisphaerales bacterium]
MNAVAVRKFCTLQEAAERLNTSQEQIETLLSRGMLREFRNGPHRLLRTADVGAILAARTRRLERQGQPLEPDASRSGSPQNGGRSVPSPAGAGRLRDTLADETRLDIEEPPTAGRTRSRRNAGPASPGGRRSSSRSSRRPRLSDGRPKRRAKPEVAPSRQSLSVREWFWTGLLQDRPITIALLSGIVLLTVSGLVAGVCWFADTLR